MSKNSIKVAAFFGSPRVEGNTDLLLREAIKGIKNAGCGDLKVFNLNTMDIMACQDCDECVETGECIYNDDMDQIYDAIRDSNRFILASPIFFFGISAQAKAMVDRSQSLWCEKYLLKKPLPQKPVKRKGLFISVGGMKQEIGYKCTQATAKAFFRSISVDKHENLAVVGVDSKGAILKHPNELKRAYSAGKRLVEL